MWLVEEEEAAADAVARVLGAALEQALDLGAQLGRAALVGVEDEDPLVAGAVHRPVLLGRRPEVGVLEQLHVRRERAHDLDRAIGRERVDDQDLVAPQERADAIRDLALLVEGGDDRRDLLARSCLGRLRHGSAALPEAPPDANSTTRPPPRPDISAGAAKRPSSPVGRRPLEHRLAQPAVAAHPQLEQDRHHHDVQDEARPGPHQPPARRGEEQRRHEQEPGAGDVHHHAVGGVASAAQRARQQVELEVEHQADHHHREQRARERQQARQIRRAHEHRHQLLRRQHVEGADATVNP